MNKKLRVGVVGLGGIGGFYGGKLAQYYIQHPEVEVIFIARGETKRKIEIDGLTLILDSEKHKAYPRFVSNDPEKIGKLDLILFCVKSYDIGSAASALADCIDENTFLLPLQNGIESIETLSKMYPDSKLLWGCVYLVAKIEAPGIVRVKGDYNRLIWGNPAIPQSELDKIQKVFDDAGIHNELYPDIMSKVWEKFSFISPLASMTSLTNKTVGEILETPDLLDKTKKLIAELKALASANRTHLPDDLIDKNIQIMRQLPYEARSSMHYDFSHHKKTEVETLVGYVLREAKRLGVNVVTYQDVYDQLKKMPSVFY